MDLCELGYVGEFISTIRIMIGTVGLIHTWDNIGTKDNCKWI